MKFSQFLQQNPETKIYMAQVKEEFKSHGFDPMLVDATADAFCAGYEAGKQSSRIKTSVLVLIFLSGIYIGALATYLITTYAS